MAVDGPRRSGRARKPVQTYAEEQAEQEAVAVKTPAKRGKKRSAAEIAGSAPENDADYNAPVATSDLAIDSEGSKRPVKRAKKTTKATKAKPADVVDESEDSPSDDDTPAYGPAAAAKRIKKIKDDDGRPIRVWPQSKLYPLPKGKSGKPDWHAEAAERRIELTKSKIKPLASGQQETRLRPFVTEPSEEHERFVERANTDRMYIIDRERGIDDGCHAGHDDCPMEMLQIAGSKGNVYTVTISHMPSCNCPVNLFKKSGQEQCCKHILYVLFHVLKAPEHLRKQNAFLTSELREIFDHAPPLSTEVAEDEPKDGNRKPMSDDCPICFTEFEDGEDAVWCRAACGNNVHKKCFDQWAKARGAHVTCPFCRSAWVSATGAKTKVNVADIQVPTERGVNGYVNVGHLLDYD